MSQIILNSPEVVENESEPGIRLEINNLESEKDLEESYDNFNEDLNEPIDENNKSSSPEVKKRKSCKRRNWKEELFEKEKECNAEIISIDDIPIGEILDKNIQIKREQKCKYRSSSGTIEFRVIRQIVERVGMNSEAEKKKVCQNNKIQTYQKKYGCSHPMKIKEQREKLKDSWLNKIVKQAKLSEATILKIKDIDIEKIIEDNISISPDDWCEYITKFGVTRKKTVKNAIHQNGMYLPKESDWTKELFDKERECKSKIISINNIPIEEILEKKIKIKSKDMCNFKAHCGYLGKKSVLRILDSGGMYSDDEIVENKVIKAKAKFTQIYGVDNPNKVKDIRDKAKATCLENYGCENPAQSDEVKEKMRDTCLKNYGCKYASQSEKVRNKVKATCLEKYGCEHSLQSQYVKNKSKITCLEKYGCENPAQSHEVKEKMRATCLKNHGCEYSMQSENIRNKAKVTCLKNYGCEYPCQSDEVKEKMRATCLKNYGCEHAMQSEKVRNIAKVTCLEKYGCEHAMQSEKVKEKSKATCLKKYGVEYCLQSQYVKNKSKATCLEKYGFENPMQNPEILKKTRSNYSKESIVYLKYFERKNNCKLQHAENGGEFIPIPGRGFRADGYWKERNIIIEYHGVAFHGYPTRKYTEKDIHPFSKKTLSECRENTLQRTELLRENGFEVIEVWSEDWMAFLKSMKRIQKGHFNLKTIKS